MNSLNKDQWTAVDKRFDKRFGTFYVSYAVKSFGEKDVKRFFHSELEKVRQEAEDNMRKRCVEALPEAEYPLEEFDYGWNACLDQSTQNINNLDKGK